MEARVHPTMIPASWPLAAVAGVFNAILVTGDAVGEQMFYGRGAGQMPTASAVWSDVLEIARRAAHAHEAQPEDFPLAAEGGPGIRPVRQARVGRTTSGSWPRTARAPWPRWPASWAAMTSRIASVIQKGRGGSSAVPVVMMTHEAVEGQVQDALAEIDQLPVVAQPTVRLRVEA